MTMISVTITRPEEWVQQRRLATGENVPNTISFDVNTAALSEASRRAILAQFGGEYRDIANLKYGTDYTISRFDNYGHEPFFLSCDNPTAADVDLAIIAAAVRIEQQHTEYEAKQAEITAAAEARKAEKEQREQKLAEARELLSDELAAGKKAQEDRSILAGFITALPADAKRGALRKLAAESTGDAVNALRQKIEDASPVWILKDFDEEDDEE
jgi:hypothetical protein